MNFCKIHQVFGSTTERNITYLSARYADPKFLKESIAYITRGFFDNHELINGKSILLKPNWVTHNRKDADTICLRTHDSFLLATLELILEQKPSKVTIGDAPIQGCDWDKMITDYFYDSVNELSKKYNTEIKIKDFRRVTFDSALNNLTKERNPLSDYIMFDLGKDSALEVISSDKNIFRVTSYDPDRLAISHKKGIHKYCITKELFDADVIISLPKVKTHQKTGITCALKNIVGINGDKDFLPHHRVGGSAFGGDCYPGGNLLRRISEYFLYNANRKQGKKVYFFWFYISLLFWKISFPKNVHQIAAGWYGNDTTWRMVMDLNKIINYGNKNGTISDKHQRVHFSLCDGVIGGQGDGPLNPQPLPLGVISFSDNSYLTDICMTKLIGFKTDKIPLITHAKNVVKDLDNLIMLDGKKIDIEDLENFRITTTPPPGWFNYCIKSK